MKVVGLTGGIATGKSVVASMLRELGAKIINADELAREIVKPDQDAWREIVENFGPDILHRDQTIDREKLRKIVFAEKAARKRLESITHPRIRALAHERIRKMAAEGAEITVYEAPLLFENQIHFWLRPVILVASESGAQRQRLQERDRLTAVEVEQHLEAQMPVEEKRKLADFVIENNGDLQALKRQVQEVWEKITTIEDTG